jgi:hypothetical protein
MTSVGRNAENLEPCALQVRMQNGPPSSEAVSQKAKHWTIATVLSGLNTKELDESFPYQLS